MSSDPMKFDPIKLATRVAEVLGATRGIAYAQLSPNLEILYASENLLDLLPEAEEWVEGQPVTMLLREFVGAEESLMDILRGEIPSYHLDRVNRSQDDGAIKYFNFSVLPIDGAHPKQGLLLIAEDVTPTGLLEQNLIQDRSELSLVQAQLAEANEALRRLNRLKSVLLSIVAHDLRTPLTAILGYAELLQHNLQDAGAPRQEEFLATIISQANWLNRLIMDILDLDQIEQGKLSIKPKLCNLNSIIPKAAELVEDTASYRNLDIQLDLREEILLIEADQDRLGQILNNLISNAIKYTPEGGQIQISARKDGHQAVLAVQDTGYGMTEEEQATLFQLNYRTEGARQSKVKGTGLGLFIVKNLVDAHHGEIHVSSQTGQGTTISVRLPEKQERSTG